MRAARATTSMALLGVACCALLLAACDGGGGSGGGAAPAATSPAATNTSVTLAWKDAAGPVAGYKVYVQRDGSPYEYEGDVFEPAVALSGPPGQTARVVVIGFDGAGNTGPGSPPSPRFTFPARSGSATASASEPALPAPKSSAATTTSASIDTTTTHIAGDDSGDGSPAVEDLAGALVWQGDGVLRVTDASLETSLLFAPPAPGDTLIAIGDFDGDGLGDLLWLSGSTELSYTPSTALLLRLASTPAIALGSLEAGERVAGTGDFDGDGRDDLLVLRGTAAVDVWFTGADGTSGIAEIGSAGEATLAALGDFDDNGVEDLVWRSPEGVLVLWPMAADGADLAVEVPLDAGLAVASAGDFDGDGADELAVSDGRGDLFLLHPLAVPAAFEVTDAADLSAWTPVGTADLDRDGNDELVLVGEGALRTLYLPGDELRPLDPASPWVLVALLP